MPTEEIAASDPPPVVPVCINVCPVESLVALPGIGPVLAGRIQATRAAGVHFARPADLQKVKGIGPKLSGRLAPWLIFTPTAEAIPPSAAPSDFTTQAAGSPPPDTGKMHSRSPNGGR
jgi:competence protein ComEA